MANLNILTAILLISTMLTVDSSPAKARSLTNGHSSRHRIFQRLAKYGHYGLDVGGVPVVPTVGNKCLSGFCPTKKAPKFVNDHYDENVDDTAESDYRSSVLEGGDAKARKTKVFEADYVHLGVQNDRQQAPQSGNCPGCRILNIVISDVTGNKRKTLSDIKITL